MVEALENGFFQVGNGFLLKPRQDGKTEIAGINVEKDKIVAEHLTQWLRDNKHYVGVFGTDSGERTEKEFERHDGTTVTKDVVIPIVGVIAELSPSFTIRDLCTAMNDRCLAGISEAEIIGLQRNAPALPPLG